MNMEEQLRAVVTQATTDGSLWHTIIHGNNITTVPTENGDVPTVAKQLKDVRDAITGGVSDVVAEAEAARDMAIVAKNETVTLKDATNQIKAETQVIKQDTQSIKESADAVFNNISTTTNSSIQTIQTETNAQVALVKSTGSSQVSSVQSAGTTQVSNVNAAGANQVALATAQANQAKYYAEACAPTPLGSRLTVPANTKVPDGYEPVWYKNTITRARYPDFFEQLVDTNSLTLVTESTYDSQVTTYGMCASYVKVDDNTLILPLLVNFARGGTTSQLGGVHLDQFQGHYHIAQIRQDVYGSGDGYTLYSTSGTDEGLRQDGPDLYILDPKTGAHGTARFGTETRPKAYYELNYIKCADISRPLTSEETGQIRTSLTTKLETSLSNISSQAKKTIVSLCMPDFSRGITVAQNATSYTAPCDGILMFNFSGNSGGGDLHCTIDGKTVYRAHADYSNCHNGNFPIPSGKTVSISRSNGTFGTNYAIFYPLKGA